ncbi:hypothetical protein M2140_001922 [Clostridiales Family XIII bacterium PM5-7]
MTADEFKAIKQRVKAEMERRSLAGLDQDEEPIDFGSLREFSEEEYDFVEVPEKGSRVLAEHGEKTINILYAVEDQEASFVRKGEPLPSVNSLDDYLDLISSESIEGETSSCRGACSGLCFGSCIGGCNGCSGACDSGCQGCTATCGTACASSTMV